MTFVAGHQPNLYPYGGFFAKAASVDCFVIVDNTQYVKKQYHNRNRIMLLNGQVIWLGIPVKNAGHFKQAINNVEIDNRQNWRQKHRRSLEVNYRNRPYFEQYFPEFVKLLEREWQFLAEYNIEFIKLCFQLLGITTHISIASETEISGQSSELILNICKKNGANTYLHGKHSRDYVDFDFLSQSGIKNLLQEFTPLPYSQSNDEFVGNLSIIDILFNCGSDSMNILLHGNKIIHPTFD